MIPSATTPIGGAANPRTEPAPLSRSGLVRAPRGHRGPGRRVTGDARRCPATPARPRRRPPRHARGPGAAPANPRRGHLPEGRPILGVRPAPVTDIRIRREGRSGRITLARPDALNALTWDMCLAVERALDAWAADDAVRLVLIDAEGDRAFCSGGDLSSIHRHGTVGDHGYARRFWRDEYRMNAKLFRFPKPVVTFLHGFVMGGGVGLGCHASHRIVRGDTRVAMPECTIGLVPDVGGSLLLARAPGRLGEHLALTAHRMGPGDAIHAGFADHFVPEGWEALASELCETGDAEAVDRVAAPPPESPLAARSAFVGRHFAGETAGDVVRSLRAEGGEEAHAALEAIGRTSPLSAACAVELIHRARACEGIEPALEQEFRFTFRATERGDFLEGIRAAIVDRDRTPRWRHAGHDSVQPAAVAAMLGPLGEDALRLEEDA